MGWTSIPGKGLKELHTMLNRSEHGWTIHERTPFKESHSTQFANNLWQIVENANGDFQIVVTIFERHGGDWAYKQISECEGPLAKEGLPIKWLNQVADPKRGYSTKWRNEIRQRTA